MIITGKSLSRRAVLRGLGATLALPLLDSMVPALSRAATKAPVRLGFVYHPTGMIMEQYTPAAEGAGFAFTPTLKPLEAYRDRLNVFTGLAQMNGRALGDGPGDHAREGATWLTGVHPKRSETDIRCGVSADQLAARELGKQTQLASLEVSLEPPSFAGTCDQNYSCAYTNTVSWRSETLPMPMETSPRALFERLFGEGESTDPAARRAALKEQRSLLDYVTGSIDRLETKLGSSDRNKLSEYLEAIRDIERRIQKAELQSSEMKLPEMQRPSSIPETFEEQAKLMTDLQIMAWQTDMTRVLTFMYGHAGSNRSYRAIGIADGHHSISHHQNDPEKIAKVAKIDQHLFSTFSYFVERLKATPDGDGSLLDHSLVLYGSSLSDANVHMHHNLPTLVVGGGGGMKGGRHLKYKEGTPLNNLFLTMLNKAGVPAESFGDSTGELTNV
ncbi:MAG: DUF1552 domain-containing protein [Acidobacteriia bacterium]|nr:DUF1552 domain-containing protein [Terriglobia bacterium]